ncbi:MAG: alpha/beta fold hydrolase [Planctomycetota bacterium]
MTPFHPWLVMLLLAGDPLPTIAQSFRPGEQSVWVMELAGVPIGQHWSRYEGVVDVGGVKLHHFTSAVRLKTASPLGEVSQKQRSDLWTDDRGHVLKADLQLDIGGSYSRVEITVAGKQASAHITQGPSARDVSVPVPADPYALANNFVAQIELVLRLNPLAAGQAATHQLFSSNVLQTVPFTVRWLKQATETIDGAAVTGALLSDSLGEELLIDADGKLARLSIPSQSFVVRRTAQAAEAIEIRPPEQALLSDRFATEEVSIAHQDVKLAGTLARAKGSTGKRPAILFVSGSGPQDRNGFASGIDLGTHEILDRLTESGFVTLRVDDRGVGASTGPTKDLTFDDLLEDALACVDFLLARGDLDTSRIAVIGHSEGGLTAMLLAHERPALKAIVLMAAAGRSIIDVLKEQKAWALDSAGVKDPARAAELLVHARFLELACSNAEIEPSDVRVDYRPALSARAWLQSHARRDPIAALEQVACPVLIMQGEKDIQVSAERDAKRLAAALDRTHRADHELHVFAGLDHLFKRVPGATSQLADYLQQRPVDQEFLDTLVHWLQSKLK